MQILIANTAELVELIKVTNDFDFDAVQPSIEYAQETYINTILGEELVENFDDLADEDKENLIKRIKPALANLAFYHYIDIGNVQIGTHGIHILSNESSKPAFRWQVQDLKRTFQDKGHALLEKLILFLEKNIDTYPLWKNSECFSQRTNLLVSTAKEFNQGYNINSSRLVYLSLVQKINYVEDFLIKPILGEYFDELKNKKHKLRLPDDSGNYELSAADKLIVNHLMKCIPRYAIAEGIHTISVELNVFGVNQPLKDDRNAHEAFKPSPIESNNLIAQAARREADNYINLIKKIIHANIDEYQTYKDSEFYVAESDVPATQTVQQMRPIQRDSFFQT